MKMDTQSNWFSYLTEKRQLSPKVISDAGLRIELGRLCIPVFDKDGNEIFHKLRRPPESDIGPKYIYQQGANAALYGWQFTDTDGPIYFVEGELDVLAMRTCGLNAYTSTGGALMFKQEWLEDFKDKECIIAFDNDQTGLQGAQKLAFKLGKGSFTWVPPIYGKDVSDLLEHLGVHQTRTLLTDSDRILSFDVNGLTKVELQKRRRVIVEYARTIEHSIGQQFLLDLAFEIGQRTKPKRKTTVAHDPRNNDAVMRAKEYPIENLMSFTNRKARCLWHNEKTPSLHLYPDNHLFCHGSCNRAYDAINVYMEINGVGFMEAVSALNRLS